jgi:KDO2-lipid IV(A) lauroyltransferase
MNPVISVATSRLGPVIGIMIGRLMPPRVSNWLAAQLAALAAASPKNNMVRAVRANQAVVRNRRVDDAGLGNVVFEVFRNAAQGYMTFFQGLARGRDALAATCTMDPDFLNHIKSIQAQGRGVFVVGPHMGNIDAALIAFQENGLNPLVLTYKREKGSYAADNAIRRRLGIELTPISPLSLRTAMRRLRQGGVVITMVDRPDPDGDIIPFFGRPARLPMGHVRMALRCGAVLQVGATLKEGARHYRIVGSEPIEAHIQAGESELEASRRLAAEVAKTMQRYIRERPSEWLMFYPVWPQVMPD